MNQQTLQKNLNQMIVWYNQRIKKLHQQIKTMLELKNLINEKEQIECNTRIKESQIMIVNMISQRNSLMKLIK